MSQNASTPCSDESSLRQKADTAIAFAPGLLLVFAIGMASFCFDRVGWGRSVGFSMLTLAIILGMLVGNSVYAPVARYCAAGVGFSKGSLLRLGIVLYGFRLTFQQVADVGVAGIAVDAFMLVSTFALTLLLAVKVLKIDWQTAVLTGAGCSICGAAAIMATEPLVKAQAHKVTVAVAIVVVFGSASIFLYPYLHSLHYGCMNCRQFGVFIGASVHEVAQVVAAGKSIGEQVADSAVIVKMIRVMMLAPFLLCLSVWLNWRRRQKSGCAKAESESSSSISIPWFALWFVAVTGLNSLHLLPVAVIEALVALDTWLLAMAMAALGLTTHLSAIRQAGVRPLLLGALVSVWLILGGAAASRFVS